MFEFLDIGSIATIATLVLTVASSVLGTKANKYYKLLKQVISMVDDNQITKEELQKLVKTIKNL